MTATVGSLFTGYGGLDMAVAAVYGGTVAWYSEIDKGCREVLATHYPETLNIGDITSVDWSQVTPVDILTAGYPCQPFSNAGNRKGKDDVRHLWPYVCAAVDALRPRLVVLENVRGHLSLGFGDVLADLSRVGYDVRWRVVRASEAGAPHGRARLFIIANPHGARRGKQCRTIPIESQFNSSKYVGDVIADPNSRGRKTRCKTGPVSTRVWHEPLGFAAFVANSHSDGHGGGQNSAGMGGLEASHESEPRQRERARGQSDSGGFIAWGKYEPAIRRWEGITRNAPNPTLDDTNGRPRLSSIFVEWMMGLPAGHVTGHGLRHAQELKMLGNGVVPQQAILALKLLEESK